MGTLPKREGVFMHLEPTPQEKWQRRAVAAGETFAVAMTRCPAEPAGIAGRLPLALRGLGRAAPESALLHGQVLQGVRPRWVGFTAHAQPAPQVCVRKRRKRNTRIHVTAHLTKPSVSNRSTAERLTPQFANYAENVQNFATSANSIGREFYRPHGFMR